MGVAVGTRTVLGVAKETTYGTPVVTDKFFEILPGETLERRNNIIQSNGMRGGTRNLRRGSRRVLSSRDGGGTIPMEVPTSGGFGRWIENLLGGTPTIAQQAATAAYLQTHTMGSLTGKSLTIQKQMRDETNTEVESFTFHGCKSLAGEFSISVDQILQASFDIDAEDVDTSTAAAAASYTNDKLFHFKQGVLKVASSSITDRVLTANVRIENALKVDRYFLGSVGLKKEPVDNDFPSVTGTVSAEFVDAATFYDRFAADSAAELILEFVGDLIASTYYETFRITIPQVRFTGDTPKASGVDVVVQDVPFEAAFDGTNPGVKIEITSTDVTI